MGAVRLYQVRPRIVRLDAAYWGLRPLPGFMLYSVLSPSFREIPKPEEPFLLATNLERRRTG